jgi:hypothetical protein
MAELNPDGPRFRSAVLAVGLLLAACAGDTLAPPPGQGGGGPWEGGETSSGSEGTDGVDPEGAPWAEAGALIVTSEPGVELDASGSGDPDGDPIQLTWVAAYGEGAEIHDEQDEQPWIVLPEPGLYVFELEVSDGTQVDRDQVMVVYEPTTDARFVLHVSVDGLRPDVIEQLGPASAPNLHTLAQSGAFTHDARTDSGFTVTLPNHLSQITSRPVEGDSGHGWTTNGYIGDTTVHEQHDGYVSSVFDVVHDHGLRTALFAGKSKFALFADSYDQHHGAVDTEGTDHGRNKIDRVLIEYDREPRLEALLDALQNAPHHYTFFHFSEPDRTGHLTGWDPDSASDYSLAVEEVDHDLGRIMQVIEASPVLAGRTTLLLTTDHGGDGSGHSGADIVENARIPFYAWGSGVAVGADLYDLNLGQRQHPGDEIPSQEAEGQPIRNGDVGNAACRLLGLPPIPESTLNADPQSALVFSDD